MREGHQSNRKALLVSIVASILGLLLLVAYMRRFQREARGGEPVQLLVMRKDIARRQPLDESGLAVRTLPETYVEERHVLASDLSRVLGVRAAHDLKANQSLLWTDLATAERDSSSLSSRVPKGMRAIAIQQGVRRALGGLLLPGDRVDVLLTKVKEDRESRAVTVPLLQNVLVLAVGNSTRAIYEPASPADVSSVVLLVTVEQASLIAQAKRGGELSLILRNEDDLEINEGLAETDDSDVLELEERERRQRRALIERVN